MKWLSSQFRRSMGLSYIAMHSNIPFLYSIPLILNIHMHIYSYQLLIMEHASQWPVHAYVCSLHFELYGVVIFFLMHVATYVCMYIIETFTDMANDSIAMDTICRPCLSCISS